MSVLRSLPAKLAMVFLAACSNGPAAVDRPSTAAPSSKPGLSTQTPAVKLPPSASSADVKPVDEIVAHASSLKDQTIVVHGWFAGFKGTCVGAPPATRSDWMLEGETRCLYVAGGMPRSPDSKERFHTEVRGVLKLAADGRPYIDARMR